MSGSEYTKNTIRYHVHALSKLFGIDPTTDPDMHSFADNLEQSIDPLSPTQINTQSVIESLCLDNPQSSVFLKKYNDLKLRNVRELPSFIYLCWRLKQDSDVLSTFEKIGLARAVPPLNTPRSPDVTLERKGVNQLQQLIADSGAATANTLPFINQNQFRSMVSASVDGPLFSETRESSRFCHTIGSDYTRPVSARPPPMDVGVASPLTTQTSGHPLKLPFQPNWLYERPTLWDDFLPPKRSETKDNPTIPIDTLTNTVQEHAVVGDLLQCLQGNQGVYIKALPLTSRFSARSFTVDESMTPTLLDTVNKILPICADYSTIVQFVGEKSTFEHGVVNHALAGAIRRLIKDYLVLLCQLEHQYRIGQLGIARLQFFLRDTANIFTQLGRVVRDINRGNCSGGAVLSLLYDHTRTVYGVKQMNELLSYLLRAASVPFFKILQRWIYRGVISDPYEEFFIACGPLPEFMQPSSSHKQSQLDHIANEYVDWAFFWERHYTLIPTNLPSFLESYQHKILNTGKYLNVVQQCVRDTDSEKERSRIRHSSANSNTDVYELPAMKPLEYDDTESKYLEQIEQAHLYASSLLLNLMINDKALKDHLKSIKRYFLLDQADFIVHFMDAAAKELCKPGTDVSPLRLSSLLELAIRTSTAAADPFKDNLKVVIFKYDLITQILMVLRAGTGLDPEPLAIEDMNLTGLEAFSVDYCVNWPVSLVLNRQVMDRYQMLFRHLFYCKHVERRLCNAWVLGKLARRADNPTVTWFATAFLLSQRMLTFIQHFQYYMSVEVIEPTWLQFFNRLNKLSNLDELLNQHLLCLEVCMDDCLLASPDLMSLFGKLCVVCVLFANFVQHVIVSSDGLDPTAGAGDMLAQHRDSGSMESSVWSVDGLPRGRSGSKGSTAASSMSGDTVLTKVTREDYGHMGSTEAFAQKVIDFDKDFNRLLVEFIDKIRHYSKERDHLSSLVSRLDFNDFYTLAPNVTGLNDQLGIFSDQGNIYIDQGQPTDISSIGPANVRPISKPRTRKPTPPDSVPRSTVITDETEDDYI